MTAEGWQTASRAQVYAPRRKHHLNLQRRSTGCPLTSPITPSTSYPFDSSSAGKPCWPPPPLAAEGAAPLPAPACCCWCCCAAVCCEFG